MPLSTNLVHQNTVAHHWKTYCQGAVDAGLPEPSRDMWRISRSIYVGESNAEAWDFCLNSPFGDSFSYILTLLRNAKMLDLVKSDPSMPDEEVTVEYVLKNLCIIGDQKSCIEQLEELWEVTGGFGTLLMIKHDFDDLPRWRQCIQMLTNDIVPALPSIDTEMGV